MESDPTSGRPSGIGGAGATRPDWRDRPGGPAAQAEADAHDPAHQAPQHAFTEALRHVGELKEYAAYYVSAKLDGYKTLTRNLAVCAVLGVLGGLAGATVVITAVTLLMGGIAQAIGSLAQHFFGDGWYWIGPLTVGLVVLVGLAAGAVFGLKWMTKTSHGQLVAKYEERQRRQRVSFGQDVEQRATAERAAKSAK